ncbi:sugar-binding domain-containing protein [Streptomyces sp. GTA36]
MKYTLDNGRHGTIRLPETPTARTLDGAWQLEATTVAPGGDSVVNLNLARLTDWRDIPELAGKSGTGNYTKTFNLSKSWLANGRGVTLAPGEIHGTLFAWINGKKVPMPTVGDIEVDITKYLRAGKNKIRLQVATTLNNQVISLGKAGVDRFAGFAQRTPTAAGLTGHVVLKPYAEAEVATERPGEKN